MKFMLGCIMYLNFLRNTLVIIVYGKYSVIQHKRAAFVSVSLLKEVCSARTPSRDQQQVAYVSGDRYVPAKGGYKIVLKIMGRVGENRVKTSNPHFNSRRSAG